MLLLRQVVKSKNQRSENDQHGDIGQVRYADDTKFCRTLRMKQLTFWMIVNKIQNHDIFKDIPQRKQSPVKKQLAVVLYRLGEKQQFETFALNLK